MKRVLFTIVLTLFFSISIIAQKDEVKDITVTGMVMDMNGLPLKGALIFVDSINTKKKTNKKGMYEIKLKSDAKLLTVYSKNHGLLSMEYTGQDKVSFLYKEDESKPVKKGELGNLGFQLNPDTDKNKGYAEFATILDILDKRFFFAKVTNGQLKIGKGTNQFSGNSDPLVLVDGQRQPIGVLTTIPTIDVKEIKVIHNGSETAEYGGLQAANGVVLITLKKI
jgi:hypothetical protein